MKTFYVMQDNSLEEYLSQDSSNSGSPGNPESGGNGCESVCENANPNSAAYYMCGCGGEEPVANIDSYVGYVLAFILIVAVSYVILNYIKTYRDEH